MFYLLFAFNFASFRIDIFVLMGQAKPRRDEARRGEAFVWENNSNKFLPGPLVRSVTP